MTNLVEATDMKTGRQERVEYRRLIMQGDNFIVVIDNDGDVDWETDDNYDWGSIEIKDITKFNQILNRASELEVTCECSAELLRYKRVVAEA